MTNLWRRAARRLAREVRTRSWVWRCRRGGEVTIATPQGRFVLPADPYDPISHSLYVHRGFERQLMADAMDLVRRLRGLAPGQGTVLDLGANNGVVSIGLIVTGQCARAIAVEPEPTNYARLIRNIELNGLKEVVTPIRSAVAAQRSTLQLELSPTNTGDHRARPCHPETAWDDRNCAPPIELFDESSRRVIEVQADRVDSILEGLEPEARRDIVVVWVDVQGFEGEVFRGGPALWATGVPVVAEVWPYGLRRAGMTRESFAALVAGIWSGVWVQRRGRFVRYPIDMVPYFWDELGEAGDFDNVVFTRDAG